MTSYSLSLLIIWDKLQELSQLEEYCSHQNENMNLLVGIKFFNFFLYSY